MSGGGALPEPCGPGGTVHHGSDFCPRSCKANPKNTQLIFATHDLSLFSRKFFRRDQLWMVRKNDVGVSELYALSDFKVRADASYDKDYHEAGVRLGLLAY